MSTGIDITAVLDDASGVIPRLGQFVEQLSDRTGLHEAIGRRALQVTRDWLLNIAQTRHDTANRLGASPSGFWGAATEQTAAAWDGAGATITVSSPGIGRAAHDVLIEPGDGKKFLTIPMIAEAYNQRASAIWDSEHLFIPGGKEHARHVIASRNSDGSLTVWYALVSSVTQQQDRTLLPSDEDYAQAALQGASDYVGYLLRRAA